VIDIAEGVVAAFDATGEPTWECGRVTSQTIPAVASGLGNATVRPRTSRRSLTCRI
jgi:hypothetical protein